MIISSICQVYKECSSHYHAYMIGVLINMGSILLGSLCGLFIRTHLKQEYRQVVFTAVGVTTLVLGVMMMLPTQHFIYVILALIMGGILGSAIHLEEKIEGLGRMLYSGLRALINPRKKGEETGNHAQVFLEMSVLFCSGSLAILGSFQAGAEGNVQLLLVKSVLDGSVSIFFAALLGPGVMLSVISVFLYQGSFVLLGNLARNAISAAVSAELGAVGGCLLVMIGMRLLDLRKDKVGNFLPALLIMGLLLTSDPLIQRVGDWLGI